MINNEELLFVVDENNNPNQSKSRKDTHAKGLWHRTSHIWIVNTQLQILCQKRSILKDTNPEKWEAHFGGHIRSGEDYIDNAIIEAKEEIGLQRKKEDMIFFGIHKYNRDKEFQGIFYTFWNGDTSELILEKEEVDEIKWISYAELQEVFKNQDERWVHNGYEKNLL
jgi:isopentenyldiphosphate isomerase